MSQGLIAPKSVSRVVAGVAGVTLIGAAVEGSGWGTGWIATGSYLGQGQPDRGWSSRAHGYEPEQRTPPLGVVARP